MRWGTFSVNNMPTREMDGDISYAILDVINSLRYDATSLVECPTIYDDLWDAIADSETNSVYAVVDVAVGDSIFRAVTRLVARQYYVNFPA